MMTEVKNLPYIGTPTPAQVELLKAGKALLGADFWVRANPVDENTDEPAIAFQHPDYCYLYGYAYVANTDTAEKFRNALACVYGLQYTQYLTTPAQWLSRVLGAEVRELEEE